MHLPCTALNLYLNTWICYPSGYDSQTDIISLLLDLDIPAFLHSIYAAEVHIRLLIALPALAIGKFLLY